MNAWQRALRGVRHHWRLHVLSVLSVAAGFLCLASSLLVLSNVHSLAQRFGRTGRVSVYLKAETATEQARELASALAATPGVLGVEHVSSEQARRQLLAAGDPLLEELPAEAFPASLEVRLQADTSPTRVQHLAERLRLIDSVEMVETYQAWRQRILALLNSAWLVAGVLALAILATAVNAVASTLKIGLERRRIELEVQLVVGATVGYVRRPFLVEGALQGAAGAALATGSLMIVHGLVQHQFDAQLSLLLGGRLAFLPWSVSFGLVALGGLVGAASALLSLRRLK